MRSTKRRVTTTRGPERTSRYLRPDATFSRRCATNSKQREFTEFIDRIFPKRDRRAIVLCDGPPPPKPLLALCLASAELFVCTDAAGRPYDELPRMPDLVIGDFDTLGENEQPREKGPRFLHVAEQNSSDSEKALNQVISEGCKELMLLGATGERLDHSLYNVMLLDRFCDRMRICLVDRHALSFPLRASEQFEADLPSGTLFSLLPLAGTVEGVSVSGALYPLNDVTVGYRTLSTLSNRVADQSLRIAQRAGSLLVFIELPTEFSEQQSDG